MTVTAARAAKAISEPILVIDIGGTGIKFGFSTAGKPQSYRRIFHTQALRDSDPVEALAIMVEAVLAEAGIAPRFIVATVPGFIDLDGDHILFAGNILGLNGRPLARELGQRVGCPVMLERDAVLVLQGEALAGVATDREHVLGMFFGTGIGTAYLQNGKPFRGGGWALELGLMPFRGDGRTFAGMPVDCLEAYCSGRALHEIATRHGVAIENVFVSSASDHALADELATFVRYHAFAIGCAVAMVSPQIIVVGGGVTEMKGYPREQLEHLVARHAPIAQTRRPMDLRWAQLGWSAVLWGAPRVVADQLAHDRDLSRASEFTTAAG